MSKTKKSKFLPIFALVLLSASLTSAIFLATNSVAEGNYGSAEQSSEKNADFSGEKLIDTSVDKANSALVSETVYVFANSDGSIDHVVNSDWLRTALDINFYEKSSASSDSLPIAIKAHYYLNDEELSPSELKGRSGSVRVRYEFSNRNYQSGYYVPYAVVSGLLLDSSSFKNVEVKNAKLLNDGGRLIVAGLTFPGLQSSLDLPASTLEIPDYFEFSANVTNFSLGMSVSLATSEVFSSLDLSRLDSLDELSAQLSTLDSAMTSLIDGSSALSDGLGLLYSKLSDLPAGVSALQDGANQINDGMNQLSAGLSELASYNDDLIYGPDQLNTLIFSTLNFARDLVSDFCSAPIPDALRAKLPADTLAQLDTVCTDIPELTPSNYHEVLDPFTSALPILTPLLNAIDTYERFYNGLSTYLDSVALAAAGASELASGTAQLKAGIDTLASSTSTLVDGVSQLYTGSVQLKSGLKTFDEQAVEKLVSAFNGNIKPLADRLRTLQSLAQNTPRNTKYLYKVAEI